MIFSETKKIFQHVFLKYHCSFLLNFGKIEDVLKILSLDVYSSVFYRFVLARDENISFPENIFFSLKLSFQDKSVENRRADVQTLNFQNSLNRSKIQKQCTVMPQKHFRTFFVSENMIYTLWAHLNSLRKNFSFFGAQSSVFANHFLNCVTEANFYCTEVQQSSFESIFPLL